MEEIYDIYGNWIARCSIMGPSNPRLANGTYSSGIDCSHACFDAAEMAGIVSMALVDYLPPQSRNYIPQGRSCLFWGKGFILMGAEFSF